MTATVAPALRRPAPESRPHVLRRPAVMCLILLLAYVGLSLAKDPRASMVSDTGGKLATLRAMDARHDLDPDLGYWADAYDPAGLAHPMALTMHIGDRWVNVTTLPMIYAAVPLYRLGGLRAILLLPMLAGVLTAGRIAASAKRGTVQTSSNRSRLRRQRSRPHPEWTDVAATSSSTGSGSPTTIRKDGSLSGSSRTCRSR